ncbi:MAG TPA: mechanosensitive ion channel domain-containing protein [Rhodanobacteraceae bacterium]|nr:mechanosensitive ion channel domain-containing protein [Rhodanobacteraceae bacterium]
MHDFLHRLHLDALPQQLAQFGVRLLTAILILLIGWWLAARVANFLRRALLRGEVEATLAGFLRNVVYGVMLALVLAAALDRIGVPSASLVAVLGAAGLAIGLGLKDSLSNLAWGVLLVVLRPFRVGDYVETGSVQGTVERIGLMQTHLVMADNREVIVPNALVGSDAIINYNQRGTRRFEIVVGIGYDDDIGHAMHVVRDLMVADPRILAEPEAGVWVRTLGASSVDLAIRAWVKSGDLWGAQTDLTRAIKERFDREGISIPYPQSEVRMHPAPAPQVEHKP